MLAAGLYPIQATALAAATTVLSVLISLIIFYFIWSIRRNVRQIASDVERIREQAETERDH